MIGVSHSQRYDSPAAGAGVTFSGPGRMLFELAGVDRQLAQEAMERAIQKLPIKARFVVRPGTHGTAEVQV